MNRFYGSVWIACSVVAISLVTSPVSNGNEKIQQQLIGKPAPEIAAGEVNLNGKAVKLSDLKGKVVLIDFWAVWCPPCVATIPTLREWQDEYRDKGLVVLAVTELEGRFGSFNKDTGRPVALQNAPPAREEEMLKGFSDYHRINYHVAALTEKNISPAYEAYGVEGIPTAVLVDRKGTVRMIKVGGGADIKKALKAEIEKLLAEQ